LKAGKQPRKTLNTRTGIGKAIREFRELARRGIQFVRIRVIRVKEFLDRLARVRKGVSSLCFATALQAAAARIRAKVDLKVLHRRFRWADFAVNNLRLRNGK
jgi:hypothetical protein